METYALVGGKIFTSTSILYDKSILIVGNEIIDIVNVDKLPEHIKKVNVTGLNITAGFIDLQLNGCGGVLFNDDISAKTLEIMRKTNLRFGCTSFLPTLISTSEDNIKKAVTTVSDFYKKYPHCVIGIHIEGPYISKIKKGIHNPVYIKKMPPEMRDFLCNAVKTVPIKITLAPEENDIEDINILTKAGVKVSIGHSNGTYEDTVKAIQAGACFATHLFNAMSAFEGREPNVVGAVLNSPSVYGGIIIDGYHVDYKSIELVKKIKQDKLFMVTDAVTPLGTNMDTFYLADQLIYVKNGKCINSDGTLAGANIDMMSCVKNAVEYVGISLSESLKMANLYPAFAMGRTLDIGDIKPKSIANITIFDNLYNVRYCIDGGNLLMF